MKPREKLKPNESYMNLELPIEVVEQMTESDQEVLNAFKQIQVREYDSNMPGDQVILTSGMHQEETKGRLCIEDIEKELCGKELLVGRLVIIPNLNAPGFINKTRYVFSEEKNENMNTCSEGYIRGDWQEFFSLEKKTAKYSWLVTKYLDDIAQKHKAKYNEKYITYGLDIHRDDAIAIPYLRIDRMWEDPEILEKLLNQFRGLRLPTVLENSEEWADPSEKSAYFQAFSTALTKVGILAGVIEEGRTRGRDYLGELFLSSTILEYLSNKGFFNFNNDDGPDQFRHSITYRRTLEWAEKQFHTGEIYHLNYIEPQYESQFFKNSNLKRVLESALSLHDWDGILRIQYERGLRGATKIPARVGYINYNKVESFITKPDVLIKVPDINDNLCVISTPESFDSRSDIIHAIFRFDQNILKLVLVGEGLKDEYGNSGNLSPLEIREILAKNPEISIDASALALGIALPDPIWSGEIANERVVLNQKTR